MYLATLLNLLNSSNSFLQDFSHFIMYKIMSSESRGSFIAFFPIWTFFFFKTCMVPWIDSRKMLNRSETDILLLFVILEEEHLVTPFSMVSHFKKCEFFLHSIYQAQEVSFYCLFVHIFIMKGHWIFSNVFYAYVDIIMWFLFFSPFNMAYYMDCFLDVKLTSHSMENSI